MARQDLLLTLQGSVNEYDNNYKSADVGLTMLTTLQPNLHVLIVMLFLAMINDFHFRLGTSHYPTLPLNLSSARMLAT